MIPSSAQGGSGWESSVCWLCAGCVGRLAAEMAVLGEEEGSWLLGAASAETAVQRGEAWLPMGSSLGILCKLLSLRLGTACWVFSPTQPRRSVPSWTSWIKFFSVIPGDPSACGDSPLTTPANPSSLGCAAGTCCMFHTPCSAKGRGAHGQHGLCWGQQDPCV